MSVLVDLNANSPDLRLPSPKSTCLCSACDRLWCCSIAVSAAKTHGLYTLGLCYHVLIAASLTAIGLGQLLQLLVSLVVLVLITIKCFWENWCDKYIMEWDWSRCPTADYLGLHGLYGHIMIVILAVYHYVDLLLDPITPKLVLDHIIGPI
jgi:hypothetical protein